MKGLRLVLIAAILLGCGSSLGYAQETAVKPPGSVSTATEAAAPVKKENSLPIYKEGWQFFVAPYFWMIGANINVAKQGAKGATASVAVPWYDLVPDYFSKVFGAMGRVEVWKERWGFFIDNVFVYMGDTTSGGGAKKIELRNVPVPVHLITSGTVKAIIRQGFLDVGGRYLLGTLPLSPDKLLPVLSCELLGGVRYNWYNSNTSLAVDATLTGPAGQMQITRGGSFDMPFRLMVVEPFLGLRTGVWFTEKLNLLLRVDVGGFGFVAYNHVDSNLEALLGYKVHDNIRLEAGYRGRYYSFDKGSGSEGIKSHGWYHGPVLGAVFSF
jgi:hypothetical protein